MAPSSKSQTQKTLDHLQANAHKAVHIPSVPGPKTMRPPKDMMTNVQGSSAGAGSGEFHVYKQGRTREYERIAIMEEEAERELAQRLFEEKKMLNDKLAEEKTAKAKERRMRRKDAKRKAMSQDKDPEQPQQITEEIFKKPRVQSAPETMDSDPINQAVQEQASEPSTTTLQTVDANNLDDSKESGDVIKISVEDDDVW